jgi:hypothetical protein
LISGEHAGWRVEVDDDTTGDTGGFYIYITFGSEGFDEWYENEEQADRILSKLEIVWDSV